MARRPKCFKWTIDMPSGPMAEDDLARCMALTVSSSEKGENSWSIFFFLIFRRTFRVIGRCLWLLTQVYCLLERRAIECLLV